MNKNLLASYFKSMKSFYKEQKNKAERSKLYSIFSSWKFYSKEKVLLKKYLRESNVNEEYAYTPSTNRQRNGDNMRMTLSSMNMTNYSGLSGVNPSVQENLMSSPDYFDRH